jgi:hypothetical protein
MTTIDRQPPQGLVHFDIPFAVSLARYSVAARDAQGPDRRHARRRTVGRTRSRRRLRELDHAMLKRPRRQAVLRSHTPGRSPGHVQARGDPRQVSGSP